MPSKVDEAAPTRAAANASALWLRPAQTVAVLTALALLLRLLFLGHKSFWLDEGASYFMARLDRTAFLHQVWSHELNMAFYYVLLRPWISFGTSEFHIRLLSVIPAVLTIPVVYLLGARLLSRRAAIVAALLLSLHAGHVAYSQEARAYALVTLLVALSSWFFVRALGIASSGANAGDASALNWIAYLTFAVLAVYTQLFAVMALAAQWAALLALRRRLPYRTLVVIAAAVAALLAPAAWWMLARNVNDLSSFIRLNFTLVWKTLALMAGNPVALALFVPLWWIALRAAWSQVKDNRERAFPLTLMALWAWLPLVITLLVSLRKPILQPRFMLMCVPALVLLAAAGLERVQPHFERPALALTVLLSLGGVVYHYARPQEDWRGATAYIVQQLRPDDAVSVAPWYATLVMQYYRETRAPASPPIPFHRAEDLRSSRFSRVWVLAYGKRGSPEQVALADTLAGGYRLTATRHFFKVEVTTHERIGAPAP